MDSKFIYTTAEQSRAPGYLARKFRQERERLRKMALAKRRAVKPAKDIQPCSTHP